MPSYDQSATQSASASGSGDLSVTPPTVEAALIARLNSYAPLTALVGSGAAARIYPEWLPQKTNFPAVAMARRGDERFEVMGQSVDVTFTQFQFSCFARGYLNVLTLAQAVEDALNRYSAEAGSGQCEILNIIIEPSFDALAEEEDGKQQAMGLRHRVILATVQYRRGGVNVAA